MLLEESKYAAEPNQTSEATSANDNLNFQQQEMTVLSYMESLEKLA